VYKKWFITNRKPIFDISLASDERDYNEEVVFSTKLIGENNGNRLPIHFDLNNSGSSQMMTINYGDYFTGNTLVSLNYYNPNNDNLDCYTSSTLCDIGLTGIDNGLTTQISGETLHYTMGLFTGTSKWNRFHYDRRMKYIQITGNTNSVNRFSGNTKETVYNIVTKTGDTQGVYQQLYGGFYQGFFKLFGYDYEVFPNRTNKGWSVEMLLRARQEDEFYHLANQTYLNEVYPDNKNTFFYFGTRAENKFYHHAAGSPLTDSGYTRVTASLSGCLKTCACSNTGVTNSRCVEVYEPLTYSVQHDTSCNCGCASTNEVPNGDKDPLYDSMSNTMSLRLSGDPKNPNICVRVLKMTGGCEVTGTCPNTGITYTTGYTVQNYCSTSSIFDYCNNQNPNFLNLEHWILVDCVWERNQYFDECDLYYRGGLGVISNTSYVDSLSNNSVLLIEPPITHTGSTPAEQVEIVNLNEKWLTEKDYRLGSLKIYVNGKLFYVINGFEEVIPRGLNTEKEKQLGVPFNIGWGGGTQGLRESLTLSSCTDSTTYQQDPEVMPNETLSGTSLSALTTNIFIEPNFAGSFDGAISQFRMYTEPLTYPEVVHNFDILRNKFNLFDNRCPNCNNGLINDITGTTVDDILTFSSDTFSSYSYDLSWKPSNENFRISITGDTTVPSFPYSIDLTQLPIPPYFGGGSYYFYFPHIDQTLKVDIPDNFRNLLLFGEDALIVEDNVYFTINPL
jgi:hypothetical protein